jgi:sn-glycerol 3-phosphate transport system permease protein
MLREPRDKHLGPHPMAASWNCSLVASTLVVAGQFVTATLAAFVLSFLLFPGRKVLFALFLSTTMIPWEATIIPNYMTVRSLGWLDTYAGLMRPQPAVRCGRWTAN